jgi:hypothetical protein
MNPKKFLLPSFHPDIFPCLAVGESHEADVVFEGQPSVARWFMDTFELRSQPPGNISSITKAQFLGLLTTAKHVVSCRCQLIHKSDSGPIIYVDIFQGELAGIIILKAYCPSPSAFAAFTAPDWSSGIDITDNPDFSLETMRSDSQRTLRAWKALIG